MSGKTNFTSPCAGRSERDSAPGGGQHRHSPHPDALADASASSLPALGEGKDSLDDASARLRKAGIESPRLEARLLLAQATGASQEEIIAGRAPDGAELECFGSLLGRRETREPLAYILGKREFWSLDFAVGPGVFIPRPESETLIEEALREFPSINAPLRVLDLGTGSGCLLAAFLRERSQACGIGVDISPWALRWARANVQRHGLQGRADLLLGNWAESCDGPFDVILCNPPYVALTERSSLMQEVAFCEPTRALLGGHDGLDAYRQLAPELRRRLAPGGRAFVEIGSGQASEVTAILCAAELHVLRVVNDLAGIPRCIVTNSQQCG